MLKYIEKIDVQIGSPNNFIVYVTFKHGKNFLLVLLVRYMLILNLTNQILAKLRILYLIGQTENY